MSDTLSSDTHNPGTVGDLRDLGPIYIPTLEEQKQGFEVEDLYKIPEQYRSAETDGSRRPPPQKVDFSALHELRFKPKPEAPRSEATLDTRDGTLEVVKQCIADETTPLPQRLKALEFYFKAQGWMMAEGGGDLKRITNDQLTEALHRCRWVLKEIGVELRIPEKYPVRSALRKRGRPRKQR